MSTTDPIAALVQGARWNAGQPLGTAVTITYSFRSSISPGYSLGANGTPAASFQSFSDSWRGVTRELLHAIEQVAGVQFVELPDNADATIQYGAFAIIGAGGLASYPNLDSNGKPAGTAGDVWIHTSVINGSIRGESTQVVLHETLHALGLKHPFDGTPDQQIVAALDHIPYTVMSYGQFEGLMQASLAGLERPVGRMDMAPLDIVALQYLYGASKLVTAPGDDVYRFDGSPMLRSIVDSVGTDTIDLSASTKSVRIDLHAGATSSPGIWTGDDWIAALVAQGKSASSAAAFVRDPNISINLYTGIDTLSIAPGSVIENAVGGSNNDTLIGNASDNRLTGNGGNDQLDGGAGFDTAVFSGARGGYAITRAADGSINVAGTDGNDRLQAIEALQFGDKLVFALGGSDATIARLYAAAFARAPDAAGLAFQLSAVAGGISAQQIATNFLGSAEFIARYGTSLSDVAYATALYRNVLGRDPDAGGLAVQVDALAHGTSRATLLLGFADSPENKARVEADWLLA
ncbi:DUF4214 domain-containing protein [Roseiterribacter gracilis]|uniref:Peptidase metallopeptidase domain-containing protein n=1 Tax=Roseiterribacter gracilis TaxID=2812848 RepID=A0A8S8XDB1_9PROT|nr:hypothetical protein TMPK1_15240 [Rhodospirillales bacterium TMPK1]